jgi:hypothetical protein
MHECHLHSPFLPRHAGVGSILRVQEYGAGVTNTRQYLTTVLSISPNTILARSFDAQVYYNPFVDVGLDSLKCGP